MSGGFCVLGVGAFMDRPDIRPGILRVGADACDSPCPRRGRTVWGVEGTALYEMEQKLT